jgi:CBS domain-containing protein
MDFRARQLMEPAVITVAPETPLLNVHRLFVEEEIHGAPVVDDDGVVRGVISSMDLLRAIEEEYERGAVPETWTYRFYREELASSETDWLQVPEDLHARLAQLTVADAMVREIVSVSQDAPIAEVARLMREQRIHRVLVTEDDELRGIISTYDLIRVFEEQAAAGAGDQPRGRA